MWSNDSNMKKNTKIAIVLVLSFLTALSLWVASNLKTMSDLDIFNVEED
jgi:hypothetical protein